MLRWNLSSDIIQMHISRRRSSYLHFDEYNYSFMLEKLEAFFSQLCFWDDFLFLGNSQSEINFLDDVINYFRTRAALLCAREIKDEYTRELFQIATGLLAKTKVLKKQTSIESFDRKITEVRVIHRIYTAKKN